MRKCEMCGKSYKIAVTRKLLRGHYNPTGKKKRKANLVKITLYKPGHRSLICTRCLKTLTKKASKQKTP